MSVVVVTDTTASLSPQLAAQSGVRLVPLTVAVAGQAYRDTEVDESILAGGRATTAGPAPGDFLAALRDAPDGAVIVTVAASLSSTSASAHAAAALADTPVEVVDSRSAAGAQALVVLAAADRAARGGSLAEVADAAREAASQVRLVGCLESLDGLARSGRLPGIAALAARTTGLQFMFTLHGGAMRPIRPAASRAAALDRMVDMCLSSGTAAGIVDIVAIGQVAGLQDRLARAAEDGRLRIGRMITGTFGAAVTLYTGPRVTGLAWRWLGGVARRMPRPGP